jgi:hypothetical protein
MIGLLMLAQAAQATAYLNGNELYSACQSDKSVCGYYVAGVSDTHDALQAVGRSPRTICTPSGVTLEQMTDVVIAYLRDRPDQRHNQAGALALTALRRTFPCR